MAAVFYSFEEAVRRLKTTKDGLRALVEQGKLREFRDGLDRLFRVDEVEAIASGVGDAYRESADSFPSEAWIDDLAITLEEEGTGGLEESEMEAFRPGILSPDATPFDIRVELGMLDAEESGVPEHPIAREAAAIEAIRSDIAADEQVEVEPPAPYKPPQRVPRPSQMTYARLSAPKKSVWQWFVGGLRNDRPAAVVTLFIALGAILAGCGVAAYLLHKLL